MVVSSSVLLCAIIIQGTYGTIFPRVSDDAPPVPSLNVRGLVPQNFNEPEDFQRNFQLPKQEFPRPDVKTDERLYYGESQSRDSRSDERKIDVFPTYSESDNERLIGEVATPIPDDTYLAETSSVSRLNPADFWNTRNLEGRTFARNADNHYVLEQWVNVQVPPGRIIDEVDGNSELPTDTVKSISPPVSIDVPPKTQFPLNPTLNIVQIRPPNSAGNENIYINTPRNIENVPRVKQVVDIPSLPPPNIKTVPQQQILREISALSQPPINQITSKNSFPVPPPPPPPLKGGDTSRIISSVPVNIIPDNKAIVSNKKIVPDSGAVLDKSIVQQVRHIWIPTSSKTGKFITIPISGIIKSERPTINKEFSLESTPVTVSDTWILKQDGSIPIFEQQKTSLPPAPTPVVQNGKVIFQNPTVVQVEEPVSPIVTRIDSQKNAPILEKTIEPNIPRNIWPARNEEANTKSLNNYSPIRTLDVPAAAAKSDSFIIEKSSPETLPSSQKSIITKTISSLPSPILPPNIQIVNGKPCPLPLPAPQKPLFPPINSRIISLPNIISTQKGLPFARIIRVNRFPTGSYYLLNRNIRPNYFIYPNQAIIQQPKIGLIRIVQTKPGYFERIPLPPVQTKQISIPVQTKQITPALPTKQITYPYASRQLVLPVAPAKSTRTIFPTIQTVRYAYPWISQLKSSPILAKGAYISELNAFTSAVAESESESSSSESSSSEESSETSTVEKAEKSRKEKSKKEGKAKSAESSKSSETESESNSESKELEEKNSENESEESLETSETQISFKLQRNNGQRLVTRENARDNIVSSNIDANAQEILVDENKTT